MEPLERLRRWEHAGGEWHTLPAPAGAVTVVLCRCDGGEEVDRFTTDDEELLLWLADEPA
jgi:hypothetical protein